MDGRKSEQKEVHLPQPIALKASLSGLVGAQRLKGLSNVSTAEEHPVAENSSGIHGTILIAFCQPLAFGLS